MSTHTVPGPQAIITRGCLLENLRAQAETDEQRELLTRQIDSLWPLFVESLTASRVRVRRYRERLKARRS